MKSLFATLVLIATSVAIAVPVLAHGDHPDPKCKKGYVLTGDHRCVKP